MQRTLGCQAQPIIFGRISSSNSHMSHFIIHSWWRQGQAPPFTVYDLTVLILVHNLKFIISPTSTWQQLFKHLNHRIEIILDTSLRKLYVLLLWCWKKRQMGLKLSWHTWCWDRLPSGLLAVETLHFLPAAYCERNTLGPPQLDAGKV